ncbi:ATP-dependent DNA helicase [Trichonephila clavipes]|nr:ATP-dependent DNA helicase [Trichonephila clavipes]
MQSPRRDNRDNFNNEIARELDNDFIALQHQVVELIPQLLPEQNHVFHQVLRKIDTGNGGLFFLDVPGGTGKTLLLNLLLISDLRDSTDIMGGTVVLLAGDFQQTLPVIQREADEIQALNHQTYGRELKKPENEYESASS